MRYSSPPAPCPHGQVAAKESPAQVARQDMPLGDLELRLSTPGLNTGQADRSRSGKVRRPTPHERHQADRMFRRWLPRAKDGVSQPEDYEVLPVNGSAPADLARRATAIQWRRTPIPNSFTLYNTQAQGALLMLPRSEATWRWHAEIASLQLNELHLDMPHRKYVRAGQLDHAIRLKSTSYVDCSCDLLGAIRWSMAFDRR